MKKESKNLGVRRACEVCKKVIVKNINLTGTGTFIVKCPHLINDEPCATFNKIIIGAETHVTVEAEKKMPLKRLITIVLISVIVGAGLSTANMVIARKETISCQSLRARNIDPQTYYNSRQKGYTNLYVNKDGNVCTRNIK